MKKITITITLIIFSIIGYFGYKELYLKYFIVFEGKTINKNINRNETKLYISKESKLIGDIKIKYGEIIFEDNSSFSGSIFLEKGNIIIGKNVKIDGNIDFSGKITIGEKSIINGNLKQNSKLFKDSSAFIKGKKPNLYITTNYPDFLKYFDCMPNSHKKEFGYIFLTSSNMDIRGKDLKPEKYFKEIYFFKNNKLEKFDFKDTKKINKFYANAKKYINLLPERKVSRFGVGFTTQTYSFDKKRADIYMSEKHAKPVLFSHEFGHVMDYAYGFIDNYNPKYPYVKKENSITEYGKFHIGEDFAEAYRFYILHHNSFKAKIKNNSEITKKYNYLKKYVFKEKEYF